VSGASLGWRRSSRYNVSSIALLGFRAGFQNGILHPETEKTLIEQNMANKRSVIKVPGLEYMNPIPLATRIGSLLVTGPIPGKDPETVQTGADIEIQCVLMFANIPRVMVAAGESIDDIIKLSVWLKGDDKTQLNEQWLAMFPDRESQPARHTFQNQNLPQNYLVQCEVTAVLQEKALSLHPNRPPNGPLKPLLE